MGLRNITIDIESISERTSVALNLVRTSRPKETITTNPNNKNSATMATPRPWEYDAILIWTNRYVEDKITVGDMLADCVDFAKTGVVIATFANAGSPVLGRWRRDSDTYSPIIPSSTKYAAPRLGACLPTNDDNANEAAATTATIPSPPHPILKNVDLANFRGGYLHSYRSEGKLHPRAKLIATWSDNHGEQKAPLIAEMEAPAPEHPSKSSHLPLLNIEVTPRAFANNEISSKEKKKKKSLPFDPTAGDQHLHLFFDGGSSSGQEFVVHRPGRLVSLNFYPPKSHEPRSETSKNGGWSAEGDKILANALLFAARIMVPTTSSTTTTTTTTTMQHHASSSPSAEAAHLKFPLHSTNQQRTNK